MCGRYSLKTSPEAIAEHFELPEVPDLLPRYNIAPTQDVPVIPSGLDRTLLALADPTRRASLPRLPEGEGRVTRRAGPLAVSPHAGSKHIRVLEAARLVRRRRAGREHVQSINLGPLDEAAAWIERMICGQGGLHFAWQSVTQV